MFIDCLRESSALCVQSKIVVAKYTNSSTKTCIQLRAAILIFKSNITYTEKHGMAILYQNTVMENVESTMLVNMSEQGHLKIGMSIS